jgi:ribosomal peptide maturation radical SAM protein 1
MTPIRLVSPPWPLYSRPSLQLGALKAFVEARLPQLTVAADHWYLTVAARVGYRVYHAVSERSRLAECLFAALLYPERRGRIARFFRREARGSRPLAAADFDGLCARLKELAEEWLAEDSWTGCRLAGFSIALCQLSAGLYLIRRLKERHPQTAVVVGGSAFDPQSGRAALDLFPEIDAVVAGEGELPLLGLVRHLVIGGRPIAELAPAPGVITRLAAPPPPAGPVQVADLDALPVPDFREYFESLGRLDPSRRFFPTLSLEVSRGCWWQRAPGDGGRRGCAFCNLNLQWRGYRAKSAARSVAEIDALTRRHKTLSVALVDNVLPRRSTAEMLAGLAALGKDLAIFAEVRAPVAPEVLRRMRAAGVRTLQAGIEGLSTRLLERLGKGTRTIQNLELMKNCEGLGIALHGNLIARFPGCGATEIEETLAALEFARLFRPLRLVDFWLGRGSPVSLDPGRFGVRAVANHPFWSVLFPEPVFRRLPFMLQTYRGDRLRQRALWRPVARAVARWQKEYAALQAAAPGAPVLSLQDGGEFLILRERRLNGESAVHRLEGASREIYLFCARRRRLKGVCKRFPRFPEEKLVAFVRQMTAARLMFAEGEEVLSLAVPHRPDA